LISNPERSLGSTQNPVHIKIFLRTYWPWLVNQNSIPRNMCLLPFPDPYISLQITIN
jgi:hypothetical protein